MHLAFSTPRDLNYETPIQPRLQTVGRNVSLGKLVFLSISAYSVASSQTSFLLSGRTPLTAAGGC